MKFSIVIPCHNKLELLRKAIYTVLEQKKTDWELCVFDNASTPSLFECLREFADFRIRYERSDTFLSVTDSWNRAIDMARGDYVVFLGDDDGLVPDYFSKMTRIIEQFHQPEVIYAAIYQFLYPGVAPWAPQGYVSEVKSGFFFANSIEPFLLSKDQARKAVNGSLHLKRNFTFNIQAFVFKHTFLEQLRQEGPVFRSSYPDYYLANVAFARAESLVIMPHPMTIVGVSRASVGYTLFNGLEDKFEEILNTKSGLDPFYQQIQHLLLPGPLYNSYYVVAMHYVASHAYPHLRQRVDIGRYRRFQIYSTVLKGLSQKKSPFACIYWSRLRLTEKLWAMHLLLLLKISIKTNGFIRRIIQAYVNPQTEMIACKAQERRFDNSNYSCLKEVFAAINAGVIT